MCYSLAQMFSLPTFSARDVVRIAVRERPDTPIVIVTGSLDEETAVEYLKAFDNGGTTSTAASRPMARSCAAVVRKSPNISSAPRHSRSSAVTGLQTPSSTKAKAESKADVQATVGAAQACKAERKDPNFAAAHNGQSFAQFYGKGSANAFGQCVKTKSKQG